MNLFKTISAVSILALLGHGEAWGNAGTKRLTRDQSPTSTRSCTIRTGSSCYFGINAANAGNSSVFNVGTVDAVACFDSDTDEVTAGAAVVKFWRVVADGTKDGSFIPSAASTSTLSGLPTDCFTMPAGTWWVEVSTDPGVGETALLTLTGRGED